MFHELSTHNYWPTCTRHVKFKVATCARHVRAVAGVGAASGAGPPAATAAADDEDEDEDDDDDDDDDVYLYMFCSTACMVTDISFICVHIFQRFYEK